MNKYILEGCVDSVESAIIATKAGANRLELCSNLVIGGTTPTTALFQAVRKNCRNRIHVLIRPRFGDFCYTNYEFDMILEEIMSFRELGADGVVIGILQSNGTLNMEQMKLLMEECGTMSVTLHRAFDVCKDPFEALEQAKQLGIQTILTSGQKDSCLDGKECLRELVKRSEHKIDIMAGSGTNAEVIRELYPCTGITSYHMSGKEVINSCMTYRKNDVHMGLPSLSEYDIWRTDSTKIENAVNVLQKL